MSVTKIPWFAFPASPELHPRPLRYHPTLSQPQLLATVTMTTPLKLDRRWLRGPACEKQVWQSLLLSVSTLPLSFLVSMICTLFEAHPALNHLCCSSVLSLGFSLICVRLFAFKLVCYLLYMLNGFCWVGSHWSMAQAISNIIIWKGKNYFMNTIIIRHDLQVQMLAVSHFCCHITRLD